ncbi:hypothetical protein G6F40_017527 [Rhizopus arrhizus]|nr:hypothetical protein G6F40_017527 [Rhizopus arrhizus]
MAGQQAVPRQALAAQRAVAGVDVEPAAERQGGQLLVGGFFGTAARALSSVRDVLSSSPPGVARRRATAAASSAG